MSNVPISSIIALAGLEMPLAQLVHCQSRCSCSCTRGLEIWSDGAGELYAMPMPTAEYDQNLFYTAVGYLLGLAISMGFLYPMSRLVKGVVEEKELRIKEVSMDKK